MLPPALRALVRSTPTVAPVPHRALISVFGSQASEFLQGILASSVPDAPKRPLFSAFLNAQGRVLYDVFLYTHTNEQGKTGYLVEYDPRASEAPPLAALLKRYVLRSKVKIRDASDEFDVWAAWGSEGEKTWETERTWSWAKSGVVEPVWDHAAEWPWGAEDLSIRDRRSVGMGTRTLVRKGDRPPTASTHDLATGDDFTLHRILHGVPEGSVDITPMHAFPMDSNLDAMGGLDFRKGCYVGQELTIRTCLTGAVRKRILPVAISAPKNSDTASSGLDLLSDHSYPSNVDIRTVPKVSAQTGAAVPRPRGTGKLLSSTHGVGLALLRLEHVDGVAKDVLQLELAPGDEAANKPASLVPWLPDSWPPAPPTASSTSD